MRPSGFDQHPPRLRPSEIKGSKEGGEASANLSAQCRPPQSRVYSASPECAPQLNQGYPTAEEVQRRIAALKQRPVLPATNPDGFEYNPDEPVRLLKPVKQVSK
jgi:hypothetical protein